MMNHRNHRNHRKHRSHRNHRHRRKKRSAMTRAHKINTMIKGRRRKRSRRIKRQNRKTRRHWGRWPARVQGGRSSRGSARTSASRTSPPRGAPESGAPKQRLKGRPVEAQTIAASARGLSPAVGRRVRHTLAALLAGGRGRCRRADMGNLPNAGGAMCPEERQVPSGHELRVSGAPFDVGWRPWGRLAGHLWEIVSIGLCVCVCVFKLISELAGPINATKHICSTSRLIAWDNEFWLGRIERRLWHRSPDF